MLREYRWEDPEFCRKYVSHWWRWYAVAVLTFVVPAIAAVLGHYWFIATAGSGLGLAFVAGTMRAEHQRIKNPNTFMGRPRPPGL